MSSTTTKPVNKTSPIKRSRRTSANITELRSALAEIIEHNKPMTVRQVFYRAVSLGLIGKTENEYKNTVCRLLADMRREGQIPFDSIADSTRWMRKPDTYTGLDDLLESSHRLYRRSLWHELDCYVEVWLEKEALAGVLIDVTCPAP